MQASVKRVRQMRGAGEVVQLKWSSVLCGYTSLRPVGVVGLVPGNLSFLRGIPKGGEGGKHEERPQLVNSCFPFSHKRNGNKQQRGV